MFSRRYTIFLSSRFEVLVNNQLDAQFFLYVYFYSPNVSVIHVPIIRRITVSIRHLLYATLCI